MKKSLRVRPVWALIVAAGISCNRPAAAPAASNTPPNTLSAADSAAGWRLLFDGSTKAGWRGWRKDSVPPGWQVVDGALTRAAPDAGDIITRDKFRNFELSIEWQVAPASNSGIFYRASEDDEAIYWTAPEMQVLDDAGHPDGASRLTSAGANYGIDPAPAGIVHPARQWNQARLLVNGSHVEHWLNGVKVVEYELGSPAWEAKVKASKFAPHTHYGRNPEGYIGLQDHGDWVAYRNIKIRVLP